MRYHSELNEGFEALLHALRNIRGNCPARAVRCLLMNIEDEVDWLLFMIEGEMADICG